MVVYTTSSLFREEGLEGNILCYVTVNNEIGDKIGKTVLVVSTNRFCGPALPLELWMEPVSQPIIKLHSFIITVTCLYSTCTGTNTNNIKTYQRSIPTHQILCELTKPESQEASYHHHCSQLII